MTIRGENGPHQQDRFSPAIRENHHAKRKAPWPSRWGLSLSLGHQVRVALIAPRGQAGHEEGVGVR